MWTEPLNDRDRKSAALLAEPAGADFASLLVCAQSGAAAIKNIHRSWCIVRSAPVPLSCVLVLRLAEVWRDEAIRPGTVCATE